MAFTISNDEKSKYISAKHALGQVQDGMTIGLGTGSTADWFIVQLGELIRKKSLNMLTTATSTRTKILAESLGIKVVPLNDLTNIDITVDGADEFTEDLHLIKGGGGALLQEKIVASASSKMVVIADESKRVTQLGKFPLPIEVVPFGVESIEKNLSELFSLLGFKEPRGILRKKSGKKFLTDEGNYILDYNLNRIDKVDDMAKHINNIAGVVEHGIFINLCGEVFVGKSDGKVEVRSLTSKVTFSYDINLDEIIYFKSLIKGI